MSASALYRGAVHHHRHGEPEHTFSYSLFMLYLDLEELPEVLDPYWLWSARRWAPARFRRVDHLGPDHRPLARSVRDRVEAEIGRRPGGPIRLLTNLRYWGIQFNPVSFYYCFDRGEDRLEALVAEVHNTPWLEEHVYVLDARNKDLSQGARFDFRKEFHVSPFLPMDLEYRLRACVPDRDLILGIRTHRDGSPVLDANLRLQRQPINSRTLRRAFCRYPAMTLKILAGIYFEALRLWWKGTSFYAHPGGTRTVSEEVEEGEPC